MTTQEIIIFYLAFFLIVALVACALLYTGSRHWYELMVKEQENHLRTRRQLYTARENAYWWEQAAREYMAKEDEAHDSERKAS